MCVNISSAVMFSVMSCQWGEVQCFKVGQLIAGMMCVGTVLLRYLPLVQQCCDHDAQEDDEEQCRCSHHEYASWHGWVLQALIVLCSSITHMGLVMVGVDR